MIKRFFFLTIIIIFSFLQSCGYKPIYSTTTSNVNLKNFNYTENKLNNQIFKSLKSFSNSESTENYTFKFDAKREVRTITKDSKGNPETFEISIILNVDIYNEFKSNKRSFISKINYSNNSNKFELNLYEKELESQIISEILKDVLILLNNL